MVPPQPEAAARPGSALPRLAFQLLGTAGLLAASWALNHIACWGLFALAALLAWPIWIDRSEVTLFERRMVLEHLTRADSGLRRWLWAGTLTRLRQVLVSLVLAVLLLALAARLEAAHWAVLAADVLVLSLLVEPVRRALGGQVQHRRLGLIARRWPLLGINLTLLTLVFAAIDFFVTGMPDSRGLPWHQVAESAFRAEGLAALCAPVGWALGGLAAAEALGRHAAQIAIPSLPDVALRIAAWGLVLVHAGALAYLFTRMQLGIIAAVEGRTANGEPEGTFSRAFVYTILALAIPYLYASSRLADLDPPRLAAKARAAAAWLDPCRPDPAARAALLAALSDDLQGARQQASDAAAGRIDGELDALLAAVEPGVDAYLDWYFTVLGEYQRLAALATGDFMELMAEQLQRHLFDDTGFAEGLQALDDALLRDSARTLAEAAERLGGTAGAATAADPCALSGLDLTPFSATALQVAELGGLAPDASRAAAVLGGGAAGAAAGAVAAKMLAKQVGAAVAAKLAAEKGFQAAAALAAKTAAKKGGSVVLSAAGGAALCAAGGPLAAVCGILAGTAAWLAVDTVVVEIDELRLREEMRAEILGALRAQMPALATALKARQTAAIDAAAAQLQSRMARVFLPARDGI